MSQERAEKIIALKKQTEKVRHRVLTLQDSIHSKAKQLKQEQLDHTKDCLKKERNDTHNLNTNNDKLNRECDQARMIRTYGNSEQTLWTRDEVRYWYNKYAPDASEMAYTWSPLEAGYTVKAPVQETKH